MDNMNKPPFEEKTLNENKVKITDIEANRMIMTAATQNESKKELSNSDKKGILFVITLVIIAVILYLGFVKPDRHNAVNPENVSTTEVAVIITVPSAPSTTQAGVTTLAPATQATTVTQETTQMPITEVTTTQATVTESTANAIITTVAPTTTTVPTTAQPAVLTDAEILDIVTKGVNSIQSDTASYIGKKNQVIHLQLNECSLPALTGIANKVLEFFAGEKSYEYDFTNGKAIDPEKGGEVAAIHIFPPTDKLFTLTLDGVASTSVSKSDAGTVYSVTVVPETSTLENPRPPYHNSACDTLDFSAFELPIGAVTKADFEYPGATVTVTVDENGKTVGYSERLEIKGVGEGTAIGLTASGEMEGYIVENWTFEWK